MKNKESAAGFTLIELVVVILIISLLSGGGISTFLNIRDKRAVEAEASKISDILVSAQRKALAGDKSGLCVGLSLAGYRVGFDEVADTVETYIVCSDASEVSVSVASNLSLYSSTSSSVTFLVLHGGASNAFTVDSCQNDVKYRVDVGLSGSVDGPVLVAETCL